MEAFAPVLLAALFVDAVIESFKMLRDRTGRWENLVGGVFGFILASAVKLNVLLLAGLGKADDGDLYWNVAYLTFGLIAMRGSGAIHDLYNRLPKKPAVGKDPVNVPGPEKPVDG